jgi:hypothetical protein
MSQSNQPLPSSQWPPIQASPSQPASPKTEPKQQAPESQPPQHFLSDGDFIHNFLDNEAVAPQMKQLAAWDQDGSALTDIVDDKDISPESDIKEDLEEVARIKKMRGQGQP